MKSSYFVTGRALKRFVRAAAVATLATAVSAPDGIAAAQLQCGNAGVEVYEGQKGVVSTTCYSNISLHDGGISVAPDQLFITSVLLLGDKSDTINETPGQLRADFTFPGSSHPGFVEPPAPRVKFADRSFRLSLAFSTPAADLDKIIDSGTTIINGFVLWTQVGGGVSSGASDPFSLTVVVHDVPEPDTAGLILGGALSLALFNLQIRYRRRPKPARDETQ